MTGALNTPTQTMLHATFEQARDEYRKAQRNLTEARSTYNTYRKQVKYAGGMTEGQQQEYCAPYLQKVSQHIQEVDAATAKVEAAYEAIPVEQRPVIDYF